MTGKKHYLRIALVTAFAATFAAGALAADVDSNRLLNADQEPGNWMSYHGSYKSWHYSALDQINTGNVSKLKESLVACRLARQPRPARDSAGN